MKSKEAHHWGEHSSSEQEGEKNRLNGKQIYMARVIQPQITVSIEMCILYTRSE